MSPAAVILPCRRGPCAHADSGASESPTCTRPGLSAFASVILILRRTVGQEDSGKLDPRTRSHPLRGANRIRGPALISPSHASGRWGGHAAHQQSPCARQPNVAEFRPRTLARDEPRSSGPAQAGLSLRPGNAEAGKRATQGARTSADAALRAASDGSCRSCLEATVSLVRRMRAVMPR